MQKGDILSGTSGYNMTLANFYQVISVSASGKTVEIVRIRGDYVNPGPGREQAEPSNVYDIREIKKKRVSRNHNGEECIYMGDYIGAAILTVWNGEKVRVNTYD